MGLKLNKPYLRAAMEADCQKIMRGEVQRDDVVMACLNEMKARFLQAVSQASRLDEAVSKVLICRFACILLILSLFLFIVCSIHLIHIICLVSLVSQLYPTSLLST